MQVLALPFTSMTIRVTTFGPISEQSKLSSLSTRLEIPQAPAEPPSTSAGKRLASPLASNWMVTSWQRAVGTTLSSIVIWAVQLSVLPLTSVTVRVTICVPTSSQSKTFPLRVKSPRPQASSDPAFTSSGVSCPAPEPSSCTVTSWHRA